jgi:hypothetical protein
MSDTKTPENKKWSWFRNRSHGSTEPKTKTPPVKPIHPSSATVIVHEINPSVDSGPGEQTEKPKDTKGPADNKKGGFFKKFMKKRHSDNDDNGATGRLSYPWASTIPPADYNYLQKSTLQTLTPCSSGQRKPNTLLTPTRTRSLHPLGQTPTERVITGSRGSSRSSQQQE